MVTGLVLASAAAIAFGSGTFVQHLCARSTELPSAHRRRRGLLHLLLTLVTQPRWLAGQALAGAGTGFQAAAMAFAPVVLVQPVIAAGLPVAIVLEAIRERRHPGWRLCAAVVLCVAGLVLFVLFSRAGLPATAPGPEAAAVLFVLSLAFAVTARVVPHGPVGGLFSGAAAGAALGVAAVCTAIPIHRLQALGVVAVLEHWSPYLAVAAGLLATAAAQQAYAHGHLALSLPALTVVNTLVAAALSVALLHEHLEAATAPVWGVGVVLAVGGVAMTARLGARRGAGSGGLPEGGQAPDAAVTVRSDSGLATPHRPAPVNDTRR